MVIRKIKKRTKRKACMLAAAAVMLLGTTAFAVCDPKIWKPQLTEPCRPGQTVTVNSGDAIRYNTDLYTCVRAVPSAEDASYVMTVKVMDGEDRISGYINMQYCDYGIKRTKYIENAAVGREIQLSCGLSKYSRFSQNVAVIWHIACFDK